LSNEAFDGFLELFWFTHSVITTSSYISVQCNFLPFEGGLLDQPHILLQAMNLIRQEMIAIGAERIERIKAAKK